MTDRARIVAEARTWIGTKYHHRAAVKGAGVDCLMLIVSVGQVTGFVDPHLVVPPYSTQFNLHHGDETYLEGLLGHMHEVASPEPGDVALWQFGRVFAHAGIVTEWPVIIHASNVSGCVLAEDVTTCPSLQFVDHKGSEAIRRPVKFLSLWQ